MAIHFTADLVLGRRTFGLSDMSEKDFRTCPRDLSDFRTFSEFLGHVRKSGCPSRQYFKRYRQNLANRVSCWSEEGRARHVLGDSAGRSWLGYFKISNFELKWQLRACSFLLERRALSESLALDRVGVGGRFRRHIAAATARGTATSMMQQAHYASYARHRIADTATPNASAKATRQGDLGPAWLVSM